MLCCVYMLYAYTCTYIWLCNVYVYTSMCIHTLRVCRRKPSDICPHGWVVGRTVARKKYKSITHAPSHEEQFDARGSHFNLNPLGRTEALQHKCCAICSSCMRTNE